MFDWLRNLFGRQPAKQSQDIGHPAGRDIKARYEAALTTAENRPLWLATDYLSAKAANSFGVRRTLKIRSRYEAANNSYFRGIVDSIANDLVGTGPRLQVRLEDRMASKRVEFAWNQWSRAISLPDKLRLLAKAKITDGEAFALLVTNPMLRVTVGGTVNVSDSVQLDVIPIESDQVTTPDPGFIDYFWVDGIVLDRIGNPTEYHVLRHHPGDLFVPQLNPMVYDRLPPRIVAHWFRQDRPGQVRGVPEITPALDLFAQLRRYTKAVLTAAETAADVAAYLKTQAPPDGETDDPNPFDQLPIDRGIMLTLPAGTDIAQIKAEQPTTTYEAFVRTLLREIARCLQVPANVALGDSSTYNYSSGRLDHLNYHRRMKIERAQCEHIILQKIFHAWLEEAVMIEGLLPPGITSAHIPHRWFWDSVESIDPVKDETANQIALMNATTNLAELYAERGMEWEEAIIQRGHEIDLMQKVGVPYTLPKGVTDKANEGVSGMTPEIGHGVGQEAK